MKVFAPGKLLLTGAYAVLEGAPAIVVAVARGAIADGSAAAISTTPEVRAAFGEAPAPLVAAGALFDGEKKLGLGASAAILVASLGLRAAERGEDLASAPVRARLFDEARTAHARVQGGGSGVDVAASVHGGVLEYELGSHGPIATPRRLPPGLVLAVFWSGTSARTPDLRARVNALRARDPGAHGRAMGAQSEASHQASDAVRRGSLGDFVESARRSAVALHALGRASDAPIVPPSFSRLAELAAREGAAFLGSGAGGGDIAVFLGSERPSQALLACAEGFGVKELDVALDDGSSKPGLRGVRLCQGN